MPRNRRRKTERGTKDVFLYEEAYKETQDGRSMRAAASMFDLCHVSLMRYIRKKELNPQREITMGYNSARKVFSTQQENEISKYLVRTADIYFGLSPTEVRRLAYDLAVRYNLKRPLTWDKNKTAGIEWFLGYMKRNPELSIRCAEATSLSRATSFNRTNVSAFFNNLDKVMQRYNFEPKDIYNMDETGITTVQKPDRIVTRKGTRRVGAITSAERGVLVTVAMAVNALGNALPPFFVFPRIRYQDHFVRDGPTGSVGAGNSSGWMESLSFPQSFTMRNIQAGFRCTGIYPYNANIFDDSDFSSSYVTDRPMPISTDQQETSELPTLVTAQDNSGDVMMTPDVVPADISNATIQNNIEQYSAEKCYPEITSIISVPDFRSPLRDTTNTPQSILASTSVNAQEECVDPLALNDGTFYEMQENSPEILPIGATLSACTSIFQHTPNDYQATLAHEPIPSTSRAPDFSPEIVRPLPKAPPRKLINRGGRKKRKTAIYTDTPEKEAIRREAETRKKAKQIKKNFSADSTKDRDKGKGKGIRKGEQQKEKTKNIVESDDDKDTREEWFCLVCVEPYSASRPNEIWIQCTQCKMWAHEECTAQDPNYICHNCESD